MVFPFSYGFPMVFLWSSHGFPMDYGYIHRPRNQGDSPLLACEGPPCWPQACHWIQLLRPRIQRWPDALWNGMYGLYIWSIYGIYMEYIWNICVNWKMCIYIYKYITYIYIYIHIYVYGIYVDYVYGIVIKHGNPDAPCMIMCGIVINIGPGKINQFGK